MRSDVAPTLENDFYPSFANLQEKIKASDPSMSRKMAYVVLSDASTGIATPSRQEHPWLVVELDPNDEFCIFINRTTTEKKWLKITAPERIGSLKHTDPLRSDRHNCSTIDLNGWFYFSYIQTRRDLYKPDVEAKIKAGTRKFNDRIRAIAYRGAFCSNESQDSRKQLLACLELTMKRVGA